MGIEKFITERRGLVLILVIATILIFVAIIWAIITYIPLEKSGAASPSSTDEGPAVAMDCTHPVSYWKAHPERYPAQLVIGGQVYKLNDIQGIFSNESTEPAAQLMAQLVGAYLNFLSGADQKSIEAIIFEAYGWVSQHPSGSELSDPVRQDGTRLTSALEQYNLGTAGVAACEPALSLTSAAMRPTAETPVGTLILTPSQIATTTARQAPATRVSPSQTRIPTEPGVTVVVPTKTLFATTEIPVFPSETPSQTPQPSATNTPEPPTPTDTFTPEPTFPPTPTPSPTFPPTTPTFPSP